MAMVQGSPEDYADKYVTNRGNTITPLTFY